MIDYEEWEKIIYSIKAPTSMKPLLKSEESMTRCITLKSGR